MPVKEIGKIRNFNPKFFYLKNIKPNPIDT